jgi:hypothetical protein
MLLLVQAALEVMAEAEVAEALELVLAVTAATASLSSGFITNVLFQQKEGCC